MKRRFPRSLKCGLLVIIFSFFLSSESTIADVPTTPTGVTAIASLTSDFEQANIRVTWDSNPQVDGYTVYIRRNGTTSDFEYKTLSQSTTTEWTFSNLSGGVSYSVQVISIKLSVPSLRSAAVNATPITKPKAPESPTVIPGIRKATVSWNSVAAANNGGSPITSYLVTEVNSNKQIVALPSENNKEVTGLSPGAAVEFTVAAVNAASSSGSVSARSTVINLANTPTAPTSVTSLSPENGQLVITWTPAANGGNPITQQKVYLYRNSVEVKSDVISAAATSHTLNELSSGSYQAKVSATNDIGEGPLSLPSTALSVTAIQQIAVVSNPTTNSSGGNNAGSGTGNTGGGGGGFTPAPSFGGGGGGFTPTPNPAVSASPSPSPSPSLSPSPSPSPTAKKDEKGKEDEKENEKPSQEKLASSNQSAPQSNNLNVPAPAPKASATKPIAIATKSEPLKIVIPAADGSIAIAKPVTTLAAAVSAKATSKNSLLVAIKPPTLKESEKVSSYKVTITTSKGKSKTVTLKATSASAVNIKGLPVSDTYTLEINAIVNGKTKTVSKSKITLATKKKN